MPATAQATARRTTPLAASGRNTKSIASLWDTANAKLDPKIRRSLANVNIGNGRVIDAVLKEAVTQQKALAAKRWKVTLGGKELILRDVLAKIVQWIDHFKVVGDIAVQFNSGAASLPWAAVRFLLQVAVNDKQYLEATIEGIEIVTQHIATYAAVENLYMDSDFQLHTQMRSKVLGMYVHILSFLGESIQYFQHTMAKRTAKGAFQTSQGEKLRQIAKHDTEIQQLAKMCDSHVQRLIRTDVMRLNEHVKTSLKAQSFSDFMAWLSLTPYKEHHTRHSKNRLRGTTQWLMNDSRYLDWKSTASSSLLWLRGILGSGKTNLVSAVIDDSLQSAQAQASPVLYYYCGDTKGHGGRCDAKDVMRSLLRQLTVKNEDTFEIVEQVHLEFKRREARGKVGLGKVEALEPQECTRWIADLLQSDQATIIIDAIDEIEVADRHVLMKELISLRDDLARVLKIFLSSRDDTNLSQWLEGAKELRLQASLTQADMQHFIGHCVSSAIDNKHLLDGEVVSTLRSELGSYFLDRANGMFRWVELQLRHFCDLKSKTSIDQAMSDPAGASIHTLNHLYAKIFDRIVRTDPLAYNVAAQVFRLMMCLHEAMPPATLIAAASITRDRVQYSLELSDLLRTCSYLVVLDDELDTLRFAHASVQEYLSSLPEFSITNANSTAAWSCLLRCTDNAAPDLTIGIQPARDFDVYATMYWPVHYNAASEHDRNGYLGDALREFMFSDEEFMSPFVSWIETVDEISKTLSISHKRFMDLAAIGSETATPLFTACIYGLEFAITTLSETSSFNVNQKNASGHTGLYLASAAGQIRVVDRLLKLGADVAIEGGRQTTALQVACANGHGDIAQVILDFSSPNLTAEAITSAVQAALRNDHEQVALVLLKDDRFPMSQDTFDQVFEAAAGMGFTELMDYLHLTPKSLNENKKFATRGAEKLFLDSKMKRFRNYFESRELPRDAIATAAFYGQNEIIEFCLGKGLDIEHEGPFGTPLRTASLMGHGTTVRLLLDRDAEINATGSFGDALQAAAMRGHLSVATTLIQSGVAVDNCAGYYGNALQAAVYRGHVDVVKALLAAGASISQKGLFSDALSAAVSAGNQPIADLLLRSGYRSQHLRDRDEIIPPPMYRMSPPPSHVDLLSALDITNRYELPQNENRVSAIQGRDLSFQEAYESIHNSSGANNAPEPPNFEQQERYGSQALLIATATGQDSVVRSMLDCRTTIGLSLFDIGVVLQAASSAGRLGIVDYILLLPESPRKVIPRSLERAAWYGHVAIMRRLLECKEAYGPPSDSRYGPFIPVGDEQCHFRYAHKLSHIGLSHKKESQWSDYFSLSYEEVEINETAENGHILRILLQGCRADEPATVNFALELAAGSGLQNLFAAALSIAIRCDSARVAEILFQYCPAIDTIAPKKTFAQAEEHGALSVLYFLLQRNSDHEYQLQDYWNVFDGAAIANHTELVSYLITQTLHCQESSLFERRFVEAAQGGYISAVEAWYEQLCKCAEHALVLSQALDQACANGHATVVSYLIERGIDVNTIVEKPVEPASLNDAEGSIREWRIYRQRWGLESDECIDGVTRVQAWPRTPLHACLQATPQRDRIKGVRNWEGLQNFRDVKNNFLTKQQAVVELLLRKGAKANIVDKYGRNALHYAALHCPVPTVQAILESGKTMNLLDKDKRTPMFYAAWREIDSLTILKALMKAEAQVPDPSAPHTPLPVTLDAALSVFREGFIESESVHQVLTTGPGAVVRYLLRSQLDLQATADGFTLLLQMASADGDIDLVQLLIERNVDFKAVAHYYGSALRAAAQFGHLDCVKLLVEAGSDVDSTEGKLGWTPLRSAVHGQHLAIVQYLLDLGVVQPIDYSTERVPTRFNDKCSALTFACCSGNLDLVRMLLLCSGRSSPLSAPPEKRRAQLVDISSALQGACAHGHSRIVALLIEYGADIEENSDDSESPLTIAASTGSLETMKVLLAAGATLYDAERVVNILRTVVENENPKEVIDYALLQLLGGDDFISACKEVPGYTRIWQEDTEFILNVDIMPTSERLLTNLAALGAQRSIELLLERPTDMVDVSTQVLQTAAYFQNYEVLFTLLPMVVMPQPLPTGYQSPIYALLEGLVAIGSKGETFHKISCCEIWDTDSFENYEDLSQPDEECTCGFSRATASDTIMKLAQINETHICTTVGTLHLAACLGMLQVVRTCLEAGVDINQHHSPFGSALIAAIRGGDLEVITLLLEHHIDVNATAGKLGTPLYLACEARNLELIQLMLQHGAFVDDATPTTGTALHMACQNEDREIAEILLQHGANVNVCIAEKGTPMHVACENNDEEMIRLLLTYGADVDAISPDLGAPLHTTCKSYSSGSAEILLEHGANINIFSHSHGTPLHAACNGSGSLYAPWRGPHGDTFLQLLVKHGADVNSKGSKGETPLTSLLSQDYGHGYGSERSVEALLNSEQQCDVTQNDMEQLLVKFGSMTPGIEFCKRVLEKYPHVQPTIEMIRQVLAGPGYQAGSEILRILLARASHLIVTPEILVLANNVQNLELLAQHGCGIKITADIMEAFTKPLQLELVRYCVRSAPDVRPPKAVTKAIRAILDEPKPNATQNFSKRRIGYAQRESKALPKEIMELILARHPDVEGLPSTTAPNKTQKSDYDS